MFQPELAGVLKIPASRIHLDAGILSQARSLSNELGLVELSSDKLHITLLHQSTSGLKALSKAVKKGGILALPPFPAPLITTEGAEVIVVEDDHPATGNRRKTLRVVLNESLQKKLGFWLSSFCELNDITRDEVELARVFHISYANLTGNPGDSVR